MSQSNQKLSLQSLYPFFPNSKRIWCIFQVKGLHLLHLHVDVAIWQCLSSTVAILNGQFTQKWSFSFIYPHVLFLHWKSSPSNLRRSKKSHNDLLKRYDRYIWWTYLFIININIYLFKYKHAYMHGANQNKSLCMSLCLLGLLSFGCMVF